MDRPSFDIEVLLFKALQGSLNEEETAWLEAWKAQKPDNSAFAEQLKNPERLTGKLRFYAAHNQEAARQEAIRHLFPQRRTIPLFRWVAAAAVFVVMAVGAWLWMGRSGVDKSGHGIAEATGIAPGHEGAVLTLADGSQLLLDTVKNGVVALQNGVTARIINGSLHYEGTGAGMAYNTMSTPKGRLFQLTLPDGTQVWLNSASAIRYPLVFKGAKREVSITGEAYFEVAANAHQPFVVVVAGRAEVQVLGTHFNVNAYDNEHQIAATLLEGAVQVKKLEAGNASVILQPGQQALLNEGAGINLVKVADIDKVMAWKNGLFNFEGASLQDVMRQLERWYDIEVVFEEPMPAITFGGKMTKGMALNDLLEALKGVEGTDIQFRMEEGRKLIVSRRK